MSIALIFLFIAGVILAFRGGLWFAKKYPSRHVMLGVIQALDKSSIQVKEWVLDQSYEIEGFSPNWAHQIVRDWAQRSATLDELEERFLETLVDPRKVASERVYNKIFMKRLEELPIRDLVSRACTRAKPPWIFREYGWVLVERSKEIQKELLLELVRSRETHPYLKEEYLGQVAEEFRATLRVPDMVEILRECRSVMLVKQLLWTQMDERSTRAETGDLIQIATAYWNDVSIRLTFPFERVEPHHIRECWDRVTPSYRVSFHKDLMMWVRSNALDEKVETFFNAYLDLQTQDTEVYAAILDVKKVSATTSF